MFGYRLRLARRRAGLSLRSLAARMTPQISAQAISKYETGKMLPSSAVLVGLAKELNVSLDFLMSSQVEVLKGLNVRSRVRASARDLACVEAIVIDHLERYLAIEDILDLRDSVRWIECIETGSDPCDESIEEKALELREAWSVGLDPIPCVTTLLEDKGVKIVLDDLPESIDGLACDAIRERKANIQAVIVSTRLSQERRRFTLIREIARSLLGSTSVDSNLEEKVSERFASAFLIPSPHLIARVGSVRRRLTYYEVIRLKQIYGVPAATMLDRLGQVGILPPHTVRWAFSTFARRWRIEEPEPSACDTNGIRDEVPNRFNFLVSRAVGERLISSVRAATLLNESVEEVELRLNGRLQT